MQGHDVHIRWVGGCAGSTTWHNSFSNTFAVVLFYTFWHTFSVKHIWQLRICFRPKMGSHMNKTFLPNAVFHLCTRVLVRCLVLWWYTSSFRRNNLQIGCGIISWKYKCICFGICNSKISWNFKMCNFWKSGKVCIK